MADRDARKPRLSPDAVVEGAMRLADREGIDALTMRALADELGTKPMTLYHHVEGKPAVLALMVEAVFGEMSPPPPELEWKDAMRLRCVSSLETLVKHPWAVGLLESGTTPGPVSLAYHEAVLATLERGGLPLPLVAHAYAVLDSFIYGFAIQEASLPVQGGEGSAEVAAQISAAFDPELYPSLVRLTTEHVMRPEYSFRSSFDYGLDMLLDGFEAASS